MSEVSNGQAGPAHDSALRGQRVPRESIPMIDLGPFHAGGREDRAQIARRIGDACREVGFFYIANHGISEALVTRAFAEAKAFFDQPPARKLELHIRDSPNHRGYFPLGEEATDAGARGDLKEGFDLGLELARGRCGGARRQAVPRPNRWPDGLPGLRRTMEAYYAPCAGWARACAAPSPWASSCPRTSSTTRSTNR